MKQPLFLEHFLNRFTYIGKLMFVVFFTMVCGVSLSLIQIFIQTKMLNNISSHQIGGTVIFERAIVESELIMGTPATSASLLKNYHDKTETALRERLGVQSDFYEAWVRNFKELELLWEKVPPQLFPWIPMSETPVVSNENRRIIHNAFHLDADFDSLSHQLMNFSTECLPTFQNHFWITWALMNLSDQTQISDQDEIRFLANKLDLLDVGRSLAERTQRLIQYRYLFEDDSIQALILQLQFLQGPLNDYLSEIQHATLREHQADLKTLNQKGFALQKSFSRTFSILHSIQSKHLQERYDNIHIWYVLGTITTMFSFLSTLLVYATRVVRKPLDQLRTAAEELARGNLSARVPITSKDEVAKLSKQFNSMAQFFELIMVDARQITNELASTTSHIFTTTKQLDHNIRTQERSIQEIAASTKNITLSVQGFAKYIQDVYKTAGMTSRFAETGQESLSEMEYIMGQMAASSNNIVEALFNLKEQSAQINEVISTIVRLADQSNLLSLNTAIHAGKKGTKGQGFSVVADKIRELADQTANATLDIEDVVEEIRASVSEAVAEVDAFTNKVAHQTAEERNVFNQLKGVINHTREQIKTINEVNDSMQDQANRTQLINESLSHLTHGAHYATYSVRQLYQEIEFLYHVTHNLQTMINGFSIGKRS